MMQLNVQAEPAQGGLVQVNWIVGNRKFGLVSVDLSQERLNQEDMQTAAELVAIRHLITTYDVCDRGLTTGNGISVNTTNEATKLCFEGGGGPDMEVFSKFRVRLPDLKIVSRPALDLSRLNLEGDPQCFEVDSKMFQGELFDTNIGKVGITYHALERFEEWIKRIEPGIKSSPLSALLKRLNSPSLMRVSLTNKVKEHKAKKYGTDDTAIHWGSQTSRIHYITVPNKDGSLTLITVYLADPN